MKPSPRHSTESAETLEAPLTLPRVRSAEGREEVGGAGGVDAVAQPERDDPLLALVDGAARVLGVPVLGERVRVGSAEVEVGRLARARAHVDVGVGEGGRAAAVGGVAVEQHRREAAAGEMRRAVAAAVAVEEVLLARQVLDRHEVLLAVDAERVIRERVGEADRPVAHGARGGHARRRDRRLLRVAALRDDVEVAVSRVRRRAQPRPRVVDQRRALVGRDQVVDQRHARLGQERRVVEQVRHGAALEEQ
mmetsp:Transcript_2555/g.9817  ORF Transcript_2555/g.9817 Transcript_2555/m.9817 type:complete len:250 (-) Transcript_2555:160-909(-)